MPLCRRNFFILRCCLPARDAILLNFRFNHTQMKHTLLLLLSFLLVACSSNELDKPYRVDLAVSPTYSALDWEKANKAQLLDLERLVVPRVEIQDLYPLDALEMLESIPSGWASPALLGYRNTLKVRVDVRHSAAEHFFRKPVKKVAGENMSYAEIIDRICAQSGLVWTVDQGVVVAPANNTAP